MGPYAVAPALPAQTAQKGLRLRKFCVWGVMQWKERGPRVGLSVRPSSAASCDGALGRSFHPTGPCWPRRGAGSAGCTRGHMGAVHAGAWCPRRGRTSCGRQSTSRGDPMAGTPPPRVLAAGLLSQGWAPHSGSSRQKCHRQHAGCRGAIMKGLSSHQDQPVLGWSCLWGLGLPLGRTRPGLTVLTGTRPPRRLGETSKASRDSAHEKLLWRERGSAPGHESGEPCRRFAAPRPPFLRPGSLPSVAAASGYGVLSTCCVRRFWRGEGVGPCTPPPHAGGQAEMRGCTQLAV